MNGLISAIVEDTEDPQKLGRVLVRYQGPGRRPSAWARVMVPVGTPGFDKNPGLTAGDEVLVAFEARGGEQPYILGTLAATAGTPHDAPIEIVDESGANSVVMDPVTNTVTLTGSQTVILRGARVRIEAEEIALDADAKISLDAPSIEISADASLEASSGGVLTVRGSVVKIN